MDNDAINYQRFLGGDNDGLEHIIRNYKDSLTLYLYRFTNDINSAEDLAADVFVKLYTKRPEFFGKSTFKTWLYAIGRNIAIDERRKHPLSWISIEKCTNISDDTDIVEFYEKTELNAALSKFMQKLNPEYRQVLHLVYIEGFSICETGNIMRKSSKQMGNLVYRAKGALRKHLEMEGISNEDL